MNEFDSILDAEAGISAKSFRTANGFCRIYTDRIELVKSTDDVTSFLSSPSFIIRIVLFLLLSGMLFYQQFRLGTISLGYALFYAVPAAIILVSIIGNLNAFFYRIRSVLFILLLLWFIYLEFSRGNQETAIVYLVFTLLLSYSFFYSFGYAYIPVIERKDILRVRFVNSIPLLTRAYFLISFKSADGKVRKRQVMLPGIMNSGESEKRYAVQLMKEEGLISQT
jgi:hypothetical protein